MTVENPTLKRDIAQHVRNHPEGDNASMGFPGDCEQREPWTTTEAEIRRRFAPDVGRSGPDRVVPESGHSADARTGAARRVVVAIRCKIGEVEIWRSFGLKLWNRGR